MIKGKGFINGLEAFIQGEHLTRRKIILWTGQMFTSDHEDLKLSLKYRLISLKYKLN